MVFRDSMFAPLYSPLRSMLSMRPGRKDKIRPSMAYHVLFLVPPAHPEL